MNEIIATIIITIIFVSIFEMLLPEGHIKKISLTIIGIIVLAIILSPVVQLFLRIKKEGYSFSPYGTEVKEE